MLDLLEKRGLIMLESGFDGFFLSKAKLQLHQDRKRDCRVFAFKTKCFDVVARS